MLIMVLLMASLLTTIEARPVAAAEDDFVRSPQVQSGNFWNPDGVLYGYYPSWDGGSSGSYAQMSYHESQIDPDIAIGQLFSGGYQKNFNPGTWASRIATMQAQQANGIIPMYATGSPKTFDDGTSAIQHMTLLANGDPATVQLVQQWAYQLQEANLGPVFIRLGHEGDRTDRPWISQDVPEVYVNWFRAFHDIVETPAPAFDGVNDFDGLDNVIWAWTPAEYGFKRGFENNVDVPPLADTRATGIFPGVEYVDWIGASGYDRPCMSEGRDPDRYHQETHLEVLQRAGEWAAAYAPTLPFMLAEWGAEQTPVNNNTNKSRATWLATTREMLRSDLPGMNQIGAVVYFDRAHGSGEDYCDWRLQTASDSYPAPNESFDSPTNVAGNLQVTPRSDFGAYQGLTNTPGLFVPLGPLEASSPQCEAVGTPAGIELTWSGFPAGTTLQLRTQNPSGWLRSIPEPDPQPNVYVPNDNEPANYVIRHRVNGQNIDIACGSAAMTTALHATLVVGSLALTADDNSLYDLLSASAETVEIVDDGSAATIDDTATDVIVLAPSGSSSVAALLKNYTTSVVFLKPWMGSAARLGVFDSAMAVASSGSARIADSIHPITAGLNAGSVTFTDDPSPSQSSGVATEEALVLATVGPNAGGADSVVVLPAGANTSGGAAAAGCRIALPMFKNGTAAALTSAGEALFAQAVEHGASDCAGDEPTPDPVLASVVVGNPGALSADDQKLIAMVEQSVGEANVTVLDDNSITDGADVFVVAPSVSSGTAGGNVTLQTTGSAVIILKPWVGNSTRLGMFTSSGTTNGTAVTTTGQSHEVTNGFNGNVSVTGGPMVSYGQPVAGADVLATTTGGQPSLIVFEPGVIEVQGQQVGCRAMFPAFKEGGIDSITNDGETLFGQLLDFASGDCVDG